MRVEYNRQFYEDVFSSHLYVVTESRSIFKDCRHVRMDSEDDMFSFLCKHQSTLFMITTPIFTLAREEDTSFFVMPVSIDQSPVIFESEGVIRIRDLVDNQCYTVCNGITIFLAMIRSKKWDLKKARIALEKWYCDFKDDDIDMSPFWQFAYTSHPIPMIAEFPMYYAVMFPSVPEVFFQYFNQETTTPLSQYVDDTDNNNIKCFYATPITSMFPYFNASVFNCYKKIMFDTPFGIDDEDSRQIDIEGLFISIIRSRRGWKWWKKNGQQYLEGLWDAKKDTYSFINHCLLVLFYLYEMPYKNIKYPHWRIRSIWNQMFDMFDINEQEIQMFFTVNVVKNSLYTAFNLVRLNPIMPLSFMTDVLKHYKDRINFFKKQRYKLYTVHDMGVILTIFSPYICINNETINEYYLECSLYQLLKLENMYNTFVHYVIEKRIVRSMLYIDRIFGLRIGEKNNIKMSETNGYIVGTLLKEYLRDNRNLII